MANFNKQLGAQRKRRRFRVRNHLTTGPQRVRLTVFRSHKHVYCQVVDDERGVTLASASTRDKDLQSQIKYGGNKDAAAIVGKAIAERALAQGIKSVCLDRGSYKFHGRIAALAAAAREGGLTF